MMYMCLSREDFLYKDIFWIIQWFSREYSIILVYVLSSSYMHFLLHSCLFEWAEFELKFYLDNSFREFVNIFDNFFLF